MWRTVGGKKSDCWARAKIGKEVKLRLRRLYETNSWHITGYPITKTSVTNFYNYLGNTVFQNFPITKILREINF